jgi:hypothetical protein
MFFLPGTSPRLPVTATFMVPASLRSGVQGLLSLPSRRVHQQPLLLLALLVCFRRRVWQAHRVARKPFGLMDSVPATLRGLVLDFEWSRERLWALDLPVRAMVIEELRWLLALPWWSCEGVHFAISPDQVRADPGRYRVQFARTMAADLTLPLHVLVRQERVVTILDGVRRLLKADLAGMRLVQAKPVPPRCLDIIASSR